MCFSKESFYLFFYHYSPHKRNIRENVFNYLREIGSKEHKQEHFCPSLLKFKCILFYYILAIFFSFSSIQSLLKLMEIFLWSQCFVGFGAQECWMRSRRGRFSGEKRKMTEPLISVYVAGIKKNYNCIVDIWNNSPIFITCILILSNNCNSIHSPAVPSCK